MQRSLQTVLRIGDWRVDPASGEIAGHGTTARIELRTMRLLLCLAEHAGGTVSIDELLNEVWPEVTVSPDSVYQAVATLRRVLRDDSKNPAYIATVPRLGYRMVAPVGPWTDGVMPESRGADAAQSTAPASSKRLGRKRLLWACMAGLLVVLATGFMAYRLEETHRQSSTGAAVQELTAVAVLPFLDLTEGMRNEEFADGMTEELIDKLSKVPGLHVPSATAVFFFKNKQVALGEIAKNLDVGYVLDGSVRKAGTRLRIAARLVRVDNGYVLWSETYDRPAGDLLMVQEDIAGDVTKALAQSFKGQQ